MKKSIILSIAAAAAFATAAFTANTVSAATDTAVVKNREAKITLDAGKNDDGTSGIELVSAPTLDFGKVTIKADAATTKTTDGDAPVLVSNPGVAGTWTVNVALGDFNNGLKGATIKLADGTTTDSGKNPIAFKGTTLGAGTDAQSTKSADVMGSTGDTENGFTGVGKTSFDVKGAEISIPAGNVEGSYSAALTWTLSSDPASAASTDAVPDSTTTQTN